MVAIAAKQPRRMADASALRRTVAAKRDELAEVAAQHDAAQAELTAAREQLRRRRRERELVRDGDPTAALGSIGSESRSPSPSSLTHSSRYESALLGLLVDASHDVERELAPAAPADADAHGDVPAELRLSVSQGSRTATVRVRRSGHVSDVVAEACGLWALSPDAYVAATPDGLRLAPETSLADADEALALRALVLAELQSADDVVLEDLKRKQAAESLMRRQLLDLGAARRLRKDVRRQERRDKAARRSEAVRRRDRNAAEVVRDLVFFAVVTALVFAGFVVPQSDQHTGRPLQDMTQQLFATSSSVDFELLGQRLAAGAFTGSFGDVVGSGSSSSSSPGSSPGSLRAIRFGDISTLVDIYAWLSAVLRPQLLTDAERRIARGEAEAEAGSGHWMADREQSEVVGVLRLRQLRVRANASCAVAPKAEQFAAACFADFSEASQAVDTYGSPAVTFSPGFEWASTERLQSDANTDLPQGFLLRGALAEYPNNGYMVDVGAEFRQQGGGPGGGNLSALVAEWDATLGRLAGNAWIDAGTSAVVAEYWLYVGGADTYVSVRALFEQKLAGQFEPSLRLVRFDYVLLRPEGAALAAQVLLGALMLWLLVQKCFHAWHFCVRLDSAQLFLGDARQLVDLAVLALYTAAVALQLLAVGLAMEVEAAAWADLAQLYNVQGLQDRLRGFRFALGALTTALLLRGVLQIRLLRFGTVLLDALGRVLKSAFFLAVLVAPAFLVAALLLWQLLGDAVPAFSSFGRAARALSVRTAELVPLAEGRLQLLAVDSPAYAWYVATLLFLHVFVFRIVFAAVIVAMALFHFTQVVLEHKQARKMDEALQQSAGTRRSPQPVHWRTLAKRVFDVRAALKLDGPS